MTGSREQVNNHAVFIAYVADLLRGDYKQSKHGPVILPLTVLRRLDCVLDTVKPAMLKRHQQVQGKVGDLGSLLYKLTDIRDLWNISPFHFPKLLDDPYRMADNLRAHGISPQIRDIVDEVDLAAQITRFNKANFLDSFRCSGRHGRFVGERY